MRENCKFDVLIVERTMVNSDYRFIMKEEEVLDELGNKQLVNIVESCDAPTIDKVRELSKDVSQLSEIKSILEAEGFDLVTEVTNKDIIRDLLGDCEESEYCQKDNCKDCTEDVCDNSYYVVEVDSPSMAFYILDLLENTDGVHINSCKFRGFSGDSILWSSETEYSKQGKKEYFVFICKSDKAEK